MAARAGVTAKAQAQAQAQAQARPRPGPLPSGPGRGTINRCGGPAAPAPGDLMLHVMVLLALPPPTPGGALLDDLALREGLLLAQAASSPQSALPASDDERDLEHDMESARKKLGHGETRAPGTSREPVPAPAIEAEAAPRTVNPGDGVPRRRERRHVLSATLDGRGKAFYLTWGLVDWGIAGGMWVGATYASAVALVFASAWNDSALAERERGGVRAGSVVAAGIAAGLTIGGIFVARHASRNIGTFRDLREAGRAGITGEIAPRQRDDDDD
jgi:hypothetical protein